MSNSTFPPAGTRATAPHDSGEHFIERALLDSEHHAIPFTCAEVERFASLTDETGEHGAIVDTAVTSAASTRSSSHVH